MHGCEVSKTNKINCGFKPQRIHSLVVWGTAVLALMGLVVRCVQVPGVLPREFTAARVDARQEREGTYEP
jgi:hypothetical protein